MKRLSKVAMLKTGLLATRYVPLFTAKLDVWEKIVKLSFKRLPLYSLKQSQWSLFLNVYY